MMATSANHQKQKLTLIKPHRLAPSIVRQFIALPESPLKRLGLVGVGLLTGFGVPALVFASQQQTSSEKAQSVSSSTVTIQSTASSHAEGAASLQGDDISASKNTAAANDAPEAQVVINGETVPLDSGGSVTKKVVSDDGSKVDISVTVDHSTSSSSSSNTTDISIDSSSSSSTQNTVRGSPRR